MEDKVFSKMHFSDVEKFLVPGIKMALQSFTLPLLQNDLHLLDECQLSCQANQAQGILLQSG